MEDGRKDLPKEIGNEVRKARSKEAVILFLIIAAAIVIGIVSFVNSNNSSTKAGVSPAPYTPAKPNPGGYATVDGQRKPRVRRGPYAYVEVDSYPVPSSQHEWDKQQSEMIKALRGVCAGVRFGTNKTLADYSVSFAPNADGDGITTDTVIRNSDNTILLRKDYTAPFFVLMEACQAVSKDAANLQK